MNTVLPRAGLPASRRSNLPTIPSPTTSRRPGSPVWFRFPGLPPRSPLGRRTHFRRVPLGVCRASPLTCRLATTSGRIEFVILRTGRSPPVALHLASRQRSCLQLTGSDLTCARTCTPLVRRACRRTCRRCAALRNSCDGFPGADAPRLPAFAAARLNTTTLRGEDSAAARRIWSVDLAGGTRRGPARCNDFPHVCAFPRHRGARPAASSRKLHPRFRPPGEGWSLRLRVTAR